MMFFKLFVAVTLLSYPVYGSEEEGSKPPGCVFPFSYQGQEYSDCTAKNNNGVLWCSLDEVFDGNWQVCSSTSWTHPDCVFPFTYYGKEYSTCTTVENEGVMWCSEDEEYDGNWKTCERVIFGKECTPNKTEGYDGCRTIDITALNEELQDILNALPGGRFEKTIRGIVTIIIDNIEVSMSAKEVQVQWASDGTKAGMNIAEFNADFSIYLQLLLGGFWSKSALYQGNLALKLTDASLNFTMENDNLQFSISNCNSSIEELVIHSKRDSKRSRLLNMLVKLFKRYLTSFIGPDFEIPEELLNVFVKLVEEPKPVIDTKVNVCKMIGGIFDIINTFADSENTDGMGALTNYINRAKNTVTKLADDAA